MKKIFIPLFLLLAVFAKAQLLSWSPAFITENAGSVKITCDATKGNAGLKGYTPVTDVYVHIGAITNKSASSADWKYSKFTWATTAVTAQATSLGNNQWSYTINGGLKAFFGITDPTESIQKIAILFRNGAGASVLRNVDGSDMYIPVYANGALSVRVDNPFKQPLYVPAAETIQKVAGDALSITANASVSSSVKIYFNGSLLNSGSGVTTLSTNTTIANAGNQQIIATADNGSTVVSDTVNFVVALPNTVAAVPAGLVDGINYDPSDPTTATLVLYAPLKNNIFVLGDFNGWQQTSAYQMNITPDGNRYWIKLTGLTAGTEYGYQFLIDGYLKVADYNTEKVLDPWNDKYIPTTTYPNLKAYPVGLTSGVVSVLQTAKPAYNWNISSFTRPNKHNLLVYELLIRDFSAAQTYQSVIDSLGYLKRLGINCIELMPINEFEGNNSWGYNPSFYFAPDKIYGTEYDVRKFVDACHAQGIAVVLDIALNHSFGMSPMVQMYWDAANSKPAANSPWFYPDAHHPFNVGYDINHSSQASKDFVDRVVTHWLTNYKIDGFRWDLSKGFTPDNMNTQDIGVWSAYSQGRIDIWKRIYDKMQSVAQGSYCILEHLGDNGEEAQLANYGMMLWGNLSNQYGQATIGYPSSNADLSYSFDRQFYTQRNLIAYQESHDEERLGYKNKTYGANPAIKFDLATGMKRNSAATALFAVMPGPKMIWQFGELGYDASIGTCSNGTVDLTNCRTDPKPLYWNYYQNTFRKGLYNVYAKLFNMRNFPTFTPTFTDGSVMNGSSPTYSLAGDVKQIRMYQADMSIVAFANLGTGSNTATIDFPANGTWYRVVGTAGSATITVSGYSSSFTLATGDYAVFATKDVNQTLPVNWVSVDAQKGLNNSVNLFWTVSNEINNSHYDVERSLDGKNFSFVGKVTASTSVFSNVSYTFNDATAPAGTVYYRLKQVDNSGSYSFSKVVTITTAAKVGLWYASVSSKSVKVNMLADASKLNIALHDISGKVLYQRTQSNTIQGQQIIVPTSTLTHGVYLLEISSEKGTKTEKIIIQ